MTNHINIITNAPFRGVRCFIFNIFISNQYHQLMNKLITVFFFILLFSSQVFARKTEGLLQSEKPLLFEKIYLHVDREFYAPGDIIWLKAYQVNGNTNQLNSNYRNIFVELVAENGRIVDDLMLFSINGQASGELKTDTLSNGIYTIRAHTKFLENFGEEALFQKKIWISKSLKKIEPIDKTKAEDSKIAIDFLPEGGNMVLNAVNNVAFKAINQKGRGVAVSGKILNDLGDTILSFSTSYMGMGKFAMMPVDGRSYYALIDHHPEMKIRLPKAIVDGISLGYKVEGESLQFILSSNTKKEYSSPFYFQISHKGTSDSREIEMYEPTQTISLNKSQFHEGISKISLLDSAMNPFAERLIFVDHNKGDLVRLQVNKPEFKPREEVTIGINAVLEPGDSVASTMSISVVNKSFFSTGEDNQNIKSYLLLDSDLKGAIESPASYFINDDLHTSAEKLDLLMLVHGWRTYLWEDVAQIPAPSLDDWNDAGITISGYVKKLLWKAPAPEAEISLDYALRNFQIGKTTADKNGRFIFKKIYLLESLRVMLNAQKGDGTHNTEIILDPVPKKDSMVVLGNSCFDIDLNSDFMRENYSKRMKELDYNPEFGSILLESVDIVRKKNNAIMRSYGAYPWADKTLKITRDDYSFYNVLDYLKYKLPALTDNGDGVTLKGKSFDFMIDGLDSYYSFQEIRTIRMNEISTIDIVNPGFRTGFSIGTLGVVNQSGLIAIYKKAVPDIMQSDIYVKGRIMPKLKGYTLSGKFYSPEYTLENLKSPTADIRSTLYWNPDVQFVNGQATVGFFTADVLADYVVYLEGITRNGKICFGTTSFSVNKK